MKKKVKKKAAAKKKSAKPPKPTEPVAFAKNVDEGKPMPESYDGTQTLDDPRQEMFCVVYTTNTLARYWGHGQNSYEFAYGYTQKIEDVNDIISGIRRMMAAPKKERGGKSIAELEREIEIHRDTIMKMERVCRVSASRLLTRVYIKKRVAHLLDQLAAHTIVDRELLYLIQQRDDNDVKIRAIAHHDRREKRIRDSVDVKHEFEPINGIEYVKPTAAK